jgi:hypothetical protein
VDGVKPDLETRLPAPAVAVLDGQVADAFGRLRRLVGEMTQAELEYAGTRGDRNGAASLPAHLAHVALTWLLHVQGRELTAEQQAEIGPAREADGRIPVVTRRAAGKVPARYPRVQDMLHACTATLGDADQGRAHPAWHGNEVPTSWVPWRLAEQSIWHQAHIAEWIPHGLRHPWLRTWVRA